MNVASKPRIISFSKKRRETYSNQYVAEQTWRGSLVIKVTDLWPACHEIEPSTPEDPPCKEGRCTLNMLRLKHPPVGVVWKLGEEVPAQVSSLSLDHDPNLRGMSPKVLE
ncbi:hypothetical protein TNCV_3490121 [Trichonephila clavipes]|nr:hypothetical protein TNCV_3490121 [Trichonephila clavipes]